VLIEDEVGGEALNDIEEIMEAGGPAPDYDDHHGDHFITPPPCAHTGDKDQNTHQPHAGYIGSTDNKSLQCAQWV